MFEKGRKLLREWLDGLDQKLAADAARAGLSHHPGMIGDQREQMFRDALKEFLPPTLHVGKGKVVSTGDDPSRQVDVVIYDGRFPVLRQGDSALYPVEGVIATIEVKSTLTNDELHKGLDNCHSVMNLNPAIVKEDADSHLLARVGAGQDQSAALDELIWALVPRTYIFAFDGMQTTESLTNSVASWLAKGCVGTRSRPFFPSVIVTGGVVGIAWGDPVRIRSADPAFIQPPDDQVVMSSFKTQTRFGILASHLLWHIERRMTLIEPATPVRRVFSAYLPFEEYIDGVIRDGPYALTTWSGRESVLISE